MTEVIGRSNRKKKIQTAKSPQEDPSGQGKHH